VAPDELGPGSTAALPRTIGPPPAAGAGGGGTPAAGQPGAIGGESRPHRYSIQISFIITMLPAAAPPPSSAHLCSS